MFTSGFVIIVGFAFIAVKLPRRTLLKLLGHHVAVDIGVTVLAAVLHWGTFSGMMAAAFAGVCCSILTSAGRELIGYIHNGVYYPGKIRVNYK